MLWWGLLTTEIVNYVQIQRVVPHLGANVAYRCVKVAVRRCDGNTYSNLPAVKDQYWIDPRVQRRLHKRRHETADQRIYAVEIDGFDIQLSKYGLTARIVS